MKLFEVYSSVETVMVIARDEPSARDKAREYLSSKHFSTHVVIRGEKLIAEVEPNSSVRSLVL